MERWVEDSQGVQGTTVGEEDYGWASVHCKMLRCLDMTLKLMQGMGVGAGGAARKAIHESANPILRMDLERPETHE